MIISLDSCKDFDDNEIIKRSRENVDYFSCLYQRYEPRLSRYIMRLSDIGQEEAQDILQESFIKVWRNLNGFDSDLKFSSWVYRIVRNETISYVRKKSSYGKDRTQNLETLQDLPAEDTEPDGEQEEKIGLSLGLLDQLSIKYRDVLVLKYFEKKSYEEISDILRIPEGTVAVRINRAKKALRERIGKGFNETKNDHHG